MATIQIKRRTSSGSGPLVGESGSIKAGEPLIDLNGGSLYISKADKTASSSTPLVESDYIKFFNADQVNSAITSKVNSLGLKGAAKFDVGSTPGRIPVVGSDGKLLSSIIPQIAITDTFVASSQAAMLALTKAQVGDICVRTDLSKSYILTKDDPKTLANWQELLTPSDKVSSVNGKTGAVTISLSDLGGLAASTFNSHKSDNTHLTAAQRTKLNDLKNTGIFNDTTSSSQSTLANLKSNCIANGIYVYQQTNTSYSTGLNKFYLGINKSAVLTPSSTVDGGTY